MRSATGAELKRHLRLLSWFATFSGLAIPGYSTFFRKLVPPLFPEVGWITAGVGAATVFAVYSLRPRGRQTHHTRRLTKRGVVLVATSVVLLAGFLIALRAWTVRHPRGEAIYQIGFRTAPWSLTAAGQTDLEHLPSATPEDLMLMEAAYGDGGAAKIWKSWSIYTAGAVTLFLYLFGFITWSAGFSTFAIAMEQQPATPTRNQTAQNAPRTA
jgi:hypothetical protein